MAEESQPSWSFHGLELPNVASDAEKGARNDAQSSSEMEDIIPSYVKEQQYIGYKKGFSDGGDCEDAFDRTFPGPKPKAKRPPRRSDDDEAEPDGKRKKPRVLSLFGGPLSYPDDDADADADDELPPTTPQSAMNAGISDLCLKPEEYIELNDNGEGPSRPHFDLGAALGLPHEDSSAWGSPAPSPHSSLFGPEREDPVIAYSLRTNIDRQAVATTWVDVDRSGNYDPEEEARQEVRKLKARKTKMKKGKQKVERKERTLKCIVRLPINNMGNVENITDRHEHWPDGWSIIDSEDERGMQELRSFYRRSTPGRESQVPIPDPKGECDDLTGHPVARGCVDCRRLDQDCSMIENNGFPCVQCVEDGIDCQPLIGIPEERRERIDLDRILYGSERKWNSCTYCRQYKKRCSLKKKTDKPPCKYCRRYGIGCTFYELPELEQLKKGGKGKAPIKAPVKIGPSLQEIAPEVSMPVSDLFDAEDLADMDLSDEEWFLKEETPELEMEDTEGHRGVVVTIQTSFAHPIKFYVTDGDAPHCTFCELPSYRFVGYFEKAAHVFKWDNDLGYTEIGGGHGEEFEATTMCQECVMQRVQIIWCPGHEMKRINGAVQDRDEDFDQLLFAADDGYEEALTELQRACSMCFSLGAFKCCALQPSLMDERQDDQALIQGCGLHLCEACEVKLRLIYAGDFDAMATVLDKEPKAREDTEEGQMVVRADVGFLRREGLLMANVNHDTVDAANPEMDPEI